MRSRAPYPIAAIRSRAALARKPERICPALGADGPRPPGVVDDNEYSAPLGRRFRAPKLWFVIRAYGVEAIGAKIRDHVAWSRELARQFVADPDFEIVARSILSLFAFRYAPRGAARGRFDRTNAELLRGINDDGRIDLTQTIHAGKFVIRFQAGQTETKRDDVLAFNDVARELSRDLDRAGG